MAQKDPVCNMMVDEKKAQYTSEVNGQRIYLCSAQTNGRSNGVEPKSRS